MKPIIIESWTESEQGWGYRPDGYTLHSSTEEMNKHVERHWAFYKELYGDRVPHEYSRPDGNPVAYMIDDDLYEQIIMNESQNRVGMSIHRLGDLGDQIKKL